MYIFICQIYLPCDDSVFSLLFSPADDSAAAAALPPSSRLVRLLSALSSLSPAALAAVALHAEAAAKLSAAKVRLLLMLEELLYPEEN
jgi:hypothetical protein